MTKEQKLDVIGVLLALAGILVLLALFSPNQSIVVSTIVEYLYYLFGLGRFVVAIACLLTGGWIILRHFNENLPQLEPEQFLGTILLFVGLVVRVRLNLSPDAAFNSSRISNSALLISLLFLY